MLLDQCEALVRGAGVADLKRSQVVISGKDRVRLLNGLTTNDIKRLEAGDGCETFLTNVQGKVIGHAYVFCSTDSLVLDSVSGQAPFIIRSLDRYVVREDVRFSDQSELMQELLVSGDRAADILTSVFGDELPVAQMQHRDMIFQSLPVSVRRTAFTVSSSFQLSVGAAQIALLRQALMNCGATWCSEEAVEIARIEAGTPLFGQDISADNLPQEVDRNRSAISFTKGCYLGQETVARIDALGHVNRILRGLRFESESVPPAGTDIVKDGKTVAKITSSCFSPRLRAALCLAYVRRGQDSSGIRFQTEWGNAEVLQLPAAAF